jgi:polyisoprenyl-phosphate glycosyltransferase
VDLSVIIPMFRTRAFVEPLIAGLSRSFEGTVNRLEILFVDDACPERSHEAVQALAAGVPSWMDVRAIVLSDNVGQNGALLVGLGAHHGELVAMMDGDLQDNPHALARLVHEFHRLRASGVDVDVVAAGRRGEYEGRTRQVAGRLLRALLFVQTAGRIPRDAGLFLVMTKAVATQVSALGDPRVHPLAGLGRVRAHIVSLPVDRQRRPDGETAYTTGGRLRLAARVAIVNTPLYHLLLDWRRRRRPVPSFAEKDPT